MQRHVGFFGVPAASDVVQLLHERDGNDKHDHKSNNKQHGWQTCKKSCEEMRFRVIHFACDGRWEKDQERAILVPPESRVTEC